MRIPVFKTSFTSLRSSTPINSNPGMTGNDYRYILNMSSKLKSFLLTGLLFTMLSGLHAQDSVVAEQPKISTPNPKMSGKWQLVPALDSDTATGHIPEIQIDVKES